MPYGVRKRARNEAGRFAAQLGGCCAATARASRRPPPRKWSGNPRSGRGAQGQPHRDRGAGGAHPPRRLARSALAFARKSAAREYTESIGGAILVALLLRAFVFEPFTSLPAR